VAGLLGGAVSGAAAVLTHSSWTWLVCAVVAGVATLRWLPAAAGLCFAAGWVLPVARASLTRPEGDFLVSADAQGWTLLASSFLLLLGALARAVRHGVRARDLRLRGTPS
jgi:hypothetical protein